MPYRVLYTLSVVEFVVRRAVDPRLSPPDIPGQGLAISSAVMVIDADIRHLSTPEGKKNRLLLPFWGAVHPTILEFKKIVKKRGTSKTWGTWLRDKTL